MLHTDSMGSAFADTTKRIVLTVDAHYYASKPVSSIFAVSFYFQIRICRSPFYNGAPLIPGVYL